MHKSTTLFTFAFCLFTFAVSFAQESKIAKIDTIQTTNSNIPNAPQVEEGDVKITDGTNTLIRITDEGTFGAIEIKTGIPSTTTDKLYNDGGTLKFDGSTLGGGSGVTEIDDLTDAKFDGSSLFLGSGAGANDDGSNRNTAVGYSALPDNTSGLANTANGNGTLYSNTTGNYNTANGFTALSGNTTGSNNTATGSMALDGNKTGSNGVAYGYESQRYANNTATQYDNTNTSIGYQSLRGSLTASNNTGNSNSAIGYQSLYSNTTGYSNVANGYNSLQSNTTGYLNSATGYNALNSNTEGFHNTSNGVYALYTNTTGETNTATGSNALRLNTVGNNNTANGMRTLYKNTTGNNNTGFGKDALYNNETGDGNVALGFEAGYNQTSDNKLYIENSNSSSPLIWGDFTDGSEKVKINGDFEVTGSVALGSNTTASGANSVAIGNYASTNNLSGSMILADNSTTTVLNSSSIDRMTMRFDKGYRLYSDAATSLGVFLSAGGGSWASISDSTKKENFQSVDGEELLNKISQFKLTTWNYKTQDPTKFRHYGPIAQDFYAAFGNDGIGTIGNDTTIASADFDGINLIAIQALEKRTKIQDQRIKTLEEENEKIRVQNAEVKMQNEELKKQFVKNTSLENKVELLEKALNRLVKDPRLYKQAGGQPQIPGYAKATTPRL